MIRLDLFSYAGTEAGKKRLPLAVRMRPKNLDEFIGQKSVVGAGSLLRRMIEKDNLISLLFYGPPGSGKTTMAMIIAENTGDYFEKVNAVSAGVTELRKLIAAAQDKLKYEGKRTIVFVDEIHRFNKAQQDVLLPHVENGDIILIGATTENPYFEVNTPLLSRMRIVKLESLKKEELVAILQRALADEKNGYNNYYNVQNEVLSVIADFSGGDARTALNILEQALYVLDDKHEINLTLDILKSVLGEKIVKYDKHGDNHYDVVSAFIKSMRGSDADAALHYLARMIHSGEDIMFIARRIIICAAEDVGDADPQALQVAVSAAQAAQLLGFPEGRIPLAQAVCYIAKAPKSNAVYKAINDALFDVRTKDCGEVPTHLKDASYRGAEKLGNGIGYLYPHNYPGGYVAQQYLPDELKDAKYYFPLTNQSKSLVSPSVSCREANLLDKSD